MPTSTRARRGSKQTTDHEFIKRWIEERGGRPAMVRGTAPGGEAGILRVDFPGRGRPGSLQHITWEQFFNKFEDKQLALLYQERTSTGELSRFFKFVSRASRIA